MGYYQHIVPDTVAGEPAFDIALSLFLPWRHLLGNYESPPSCALSRNTQAAYFN